MQNGTRTGGLVQLQDERKDKQTNRNQMKCVCHPCEGDGIPCTFFFGAKVSWERGFERLLFSRDRRIEIALLGKELGHGEAHGRKRQLRKLQRLQNLDV